MLTARTNIGTVMASIHILINPVLCDCWGGVCNAGPTVTQYWGNVLFSHGFIYGTDAICAHVLKRLNVAGVICFKMVQALYIVKDYCGTRRFLL